MTQTPLPRQAVTLLVLLFAFALALTASAQAAITVQPVRGLAAVEGSDTPRDRLVVFQDDGSCADDAYAITIAWGDGTTSAGEVDFSDPSVGDDLQDHSCVYGATGEHAYARTGAYVLGAQICRGAECVTAGTGGASIANAPMEGESASRSAFVGQTLTGEAAEVKDENRLSQPGDFTAVVDWGDGTATSGQVTGRDGRFGVAGQHAYQAAGTYTTRVTVFENGQPVLITDAGRTTVTAPATQPTATGAQQQTAAFRNVAFRPLLSLRSRSLKRSALRRGLPLRISLPTATRTVRFSVVTVASRPRTLGTVSVRIKGGRTAGGVRRVDLRVPLAKALRRKLRPGSYAVRFRTDGSGTVAGQFRVTR